MAWLGVRLVKHTLVALVIFGSTVLAPLLLLLREPCGLACVAPALGLLIIGSSAVLGAGLSRGLDRGSLTPLKWRQLVASVWICNPVLLTILGVVTKQYEIAWLCSLPLALMVALLSGRARLHNSDADWVQEGCPMSPSLMVHWLVSRVIFIGMPMLLVSLQVDLFLPYSWMFPQNEIMGLLVAGGCILISAKFCAMCHCLASQRLAQALALLLLLAVDWICLLHFMELVSDAAKATMLLYLLLAAGLAQMKSALNRLCLKSRWSRAWSVRRARRMGGELGSSMTVESSDSDNEQGSGSLPDSFHEALATILGFSVRRETSTRQFLCGVRLAVPQQGQAQGQASAEAVAEPAPEADAEAPLPLEISSEHEKCAVCMEEFQPGDRVRPLPKCAHVFHAACLEQWILTGASREATKCPMCRRPALARKQDKGFTKLSDLSEPRRPEGRRSTRSEERPQPRRPPHRRPNRATQIVALRTSLGVSEQLATAAVDVAGSGPGGANLILEHASVLENDYSRGAPPRPGMALEDAVPHFMAASPSLQGFEIQLWRQLRWLCTEHPQLAMPWQRLTPARQEEVFRELLGDVQRRLQERA